MTTSDSEPGVENPRRRVVFGEMHIHSSWSVDAYAFGTRVGPEEATRFAMGEEVDHPGGFKVKLAKPLDFTLVMDHAEYTGALEMANDPASPFSQTLLGRSLRLGTRLNAMDTYKLLTVTMLKGAPIKELQGPAVAGHTWKRICEIADRYYQPGKLTTFPGWEWTSTPA